jgi:hypothetical protein
MIEMTLVFLIFKSVVYDNEEFIIYTPSVSVYLCRFICTVLLHLELIEDIKQGLNMLYYLNTHPEEFIDISQPCLIGSM